MSEEETMGPVEIAVLEFPGSEFTGEIVPALAELVDAEIVAIIDLVIVTRDDDGLTAVLELAELDDAAAAPFDDLDGEVGGLLSDEDLAMVGDALAPGATAAVVVWENTWARRLTAAVRGSGGRLVAHDRIDAETVAAAMAATD